MHARGLRLRGVRYISRINDMADIAFHTNGLRRHPELTKTFAAQYPACSYLCQRFTHALTSTGA